MANKCQTCGRNADGLPPCDDYRPYQRPDGVYCDCGHEGRCHELGQRMVFDAGLRFSVLREVEET